MPRDRCLSKGSTSNGGRPYKGGSSNGSHSSNRGSLNGSDPSNRGSSNGSHPSKGNNSNGSHPSKGNNSNDSLVDLRLSVKKRRRVLILSDSDTEESNGHEQETAAAIVPQGTRQQHYGKTKCSPPRGDNRKQRDAAPVRAQETILGKRNLSPTGNNGMLPGSRHVNSSSGDLNEELNETRASTVEKENSLLVPAFQDQIPLLKRTVGNKQNYIGKKRKTSAISASSHVRDTNGKRKKNKRGSTLLGCKSDDALAFSTDDYVPYLGKRTILAWMIDSDIFHVNEKVIYMIDKREKILLEGWITREGIHCSCCRGLIPISEFECHAGSELEKPYQHIFLEKSGSSLLECQLYAWDKQEKSKSCEFYLFDGGEDDPNDDVCSICGDGGVLVCCDSCPLTFHLTCLDIETIPSDDWHCSHCSCKFCGKADCQVLSSKLLSCMQCEEKYHTSCLYMENTTIGSSTISSTFCGSSCKEIFQELQKLVGIENELDDGFSWSIVHRLDVASQSLVGTARWAENNSKVAVAVQVMDECFVPLIDQRRGVNLIWNIVYNSGSNLNRLDFRGFYTFVLERDAEIVAVASVRIHGKRLAEMPFIGTRAMYRRQGMCRKLLDAIEHALCLLNVEKLVIPAIPELIQTWTTVFGFKHLEGPLKQEVKSINMLVFPGTGLLEKTLVKKNMPF